MIWAAQCGVLLIKTNLTDEDHWKTGKESIEESNTGGVQSNRKDWTILHMIQHNLFTITWIANIHFQFLSIWFSFLNNSIESNKTANYDAERERERDAYFAAATEIHRSTEIILRVMNQRILCIINKHIMAAIDALETRRAEEREGELTWANVGKRKQKRRKKRRARTILRLLKRRAIVVNLSVAVEIAREEDVVERKIIEENFFLFVFLSQESGRGIWVKKKDN